MTGRVQSALIVDTEKAFRKYLGGLLFSLGLAPIEASDFDEGLGLAKASGPHLAIVDHRFIRDQDQITQLRDVSSSPELILTIGPEPVDAAEEAMNLGAWDYIRKSYSQERLILILGRTMKYRETRMALKRTDKECERVILDFRPQNDMPNWNDFRRSNIAVLERAYLRRLMSDSGGDVKKAVEFSGLSVARIYALLRKHSIKTKPSF